MKECLQIEILSYRKGFPVNLFVKHSRNALEYLSDCATPRATSNTPVPFIMKRRVIYLLLLSLLWNDLKNKFSHNKMFYVKHFNDSIFASHYEFMFLKLCWDFASPK